MDYIHNKTFALGLTNGIACRWEQGGGYLYMGNATIITDSTGNAGKPKAIRIKKNGLLPCKEHALVPVNLNTFIVEASHYRNEFCVFIYWIYKIENGTAVGELVQQFSKNKWSDWSKNVGLIAQKNLLAAADAAKKKATDYHCRKPYWIKES